MPCDMIVSVPSLLISTKCSIKGEKTLKLMWENVAFDLVQDYLTLH